MTVTENTGRVWRSLRAAIAVSTAIVAMSLGATVASGQTPGLSWQACPPPAVGDPDPRQQCAQISVPLDYAAPGGRKLDIAVSRIRAADAQKRRGVLLLNPGGPGGAGLDLPTLLGQVLPETVLARYDLIGFDPRGIGRSDPVSCALNIDPLALRVAPWPAPSGFEDDIAFARGVAQSCQSGPSADVLPFITTANTARDMDRIRGALGEQMISYFGYSYGTYLGAVYASLFPDNSDRFVLDSVVSPRRIWRESFRAWGPAIEIRFPDFTRFVAANHARYGLGASPEIVRALYFELGSRLDREPLRLSSGVLLTGNVFREITRGALYSDADFDMIMPVWQFANSGGAGGIRTDEEVAAALQAMLPEVTLDNVVSGIFSVLCADAQWPENPERYRRDVRRDSRLFPVAGGMAANIWPCAFWPVQPREQPVAMNDEGPRNILLVQGLRDPATPTFTGREMRLALRRRSRITTVDVGGHAIAYLSNVNTCANDTTTGYLVTGQLPPDRHCPAEPPAAPVKQLGAADPGRQQAIDEIMRRMRVRSG